MRPRDGLARGLCVLPARPRLASGRLLGRWPQRLPWRGAELAVLFRGGLPPFPRRARLRALPPSPRRSHPCGVRPRAEILAGDGGRALVPRACGAVGCARGARPCIPAVSAVCLPASGRARSACRAVCAVRALRRASPPSSGGQARVVKGFSILQREHRGTGTRLPALRSPPDGGDLTETRRIGRNPTASQPVHKNLCTKKAPAPDHGRAIGRFPQTASRTAENGLSKVIAPSVGAVWVTLAARSDVVHVVPPAIRANVVDLARAPHPAHVEFAIRWALVGQDHQADFVKARKAGRDGCPFVRRPLRFCHAPAPFRAVLIDHTQYTPAEGGGASTFCLSLLLKTVRLDLQPAA